MKTNAANDATIKPSVTHDNVLQEAQLLWHELRGLLYEHLVLAALETRRAGESLVTMLIAAIMVAVMLIGAWLGLVAAAVLMLVEQGMAASSAILLAVAANLLIALLLCRLIRHRSHYLQFPALLGSLQPAPLKGKSS
jgi:hypothetical protein